MPVSPSRRAVLTLLALLALAAAGLGLSLGALPIGLREVIVSLLRATGLPLGAAPEPYVSATVLDLRLPRVALALLVGAALAQAGAAMQGLFRNPLADPGLVGVSSGAALASVSVIVLAGVLGYATAVFWLLPLAAFCGGLMAALLVARLAQSEGYTRVSTLLLTGLALNAIAGAGIGFLSQIADDVALRNLTFWMFGSLAKAGWSEIAIVAPLLIAVLLWLPRSAQALNALLLGEAEAQHLGIDVERLKRRVLLLVVVAVAGSVAAAGMIAFVGLVVPHLVRLWAGPDHRVLLPASALAGAALLCIADLAARLLLAPQELAVGILTALVGGPFFLFLLLRNRDRAENW